MAALEKNSMRSHHRETSLQELKALFGLFYASGLLKSSKCNPEDLWSEKTGLIEFRGSMSLKRYKFLLLCIRFDDKDTRNVRRTVDRFSPIREIWAEFIYSCGKYYSPSQWCTVDEQLLDFHGPCNFKIYKKNKPDQYCLKLVTINDAETSYMFNAEPYTGIVSNDSLESIPDYYVKTLSAPIHRSERNITVDNWFMSVPLAEKMLTEYSLTMIGALSKNKCEAPREFKTPHEPGTSLFLYDENHMLVSYAPKRHTIVLIVSTLNQNPAIDEKTREPVVVQDYNRTKGGTESFDQYCRRYSVARKTYRWPLRIFYGMLDQAGVNSCILHNLNSSNVKLSQRKFLRELSNALLQPHLHSRLANISLTKSLKACLSNLLGVEVPLHEERTDKLSKSARCHYCTWRRDRKTTTACIVCSVPACPEHRRAICVNCAD